MPDEKPFNNDEDREFREWIRNRTPGETDTSPSGTFVEIMRRAAADKEATPPTPETPEEVPTEQPESVRVRRPRPKLSQEQVEAIDALMDDVLPTVEPIITAEEPLEPVAEAFEGMEAEAEPTAPPQRPPRRSRLPSDPNSVSLPQRRPRPKRTRTTIGVLGGIVRSLIVILAAAGLTATIFVWWTPPGFISSTVRDELSFAMATDSANAVVSDIVQPTPNWARRIGIVSGHRGPQNDPGAVCPDGLTEAGINFSVAQLIVNSLRSRGYTVDLLDEFDTRLDNYQAAALISIHANTCQDFGERVSGYLVSGAAARVTARGRDEILVECIAQFYEVATGLQRHPGVTVDMSDYHSFREIHPLTPAAIIELGFMLADRQIMVERPDLLANAITDGALCFLEPGAPTATPTSIIMTLDDLITPEFTPNP